MALLNWCAASGAQTLAVTVDHKLRPESGVEAVLVGREAQRLGVPHHTLEWTGAKPTTGIEESARNARYDLLLDFCRANGIKILATAHHADDNIETFLMNLGRGSGLFGLGGLRALQDRDGIIIARPVLDTRRSELRDWCIENKVEFAEDPMNQDDKFLRVRIRKNRRLLADSLDISDDRILTAIRALDRARSVAETSIGELIDQTEQKGSRVQFAAGFLFDMHEDTQMKFFSRVLQKVGGSEYPPRLDSVTRALRELVSDTTVTLAHCAVRRLGNRIIVAPEGSSTSFNKD